MRRRLTAAGILAAALLLIVIGVARSCGGSDASSTASTKQPAKRTAPQRAADPPGQKVPTPTRYDGDGPFMTVADGVTLLQDAPDPGQNVALTFDDGPGPQTKAILQELVRVRAKATFFMLGKAVQADPETVREVRDAGMVIGNHTWDHKNLRDLSPAEQQQEIEQTQTEIATVIGRKPFFFRPPLWSWDENTMEIVANEGMVGILFSYDTQDYTLPGTQAIIDAALQAQPGSVIAFHDGGGDRTQTLEAIRPIVEGLKTKGLKPVTLDELYRNGPQ